MNRLGPTRRPIPVTVISIYFLFAAVYLGALAALLIVEPGKVSLVLGSRFMHGLELGGPYMMLLVGSGYALIGWGLFRLHNWARWLAILVIALGVGSLIPVISAAQLNFKFYASGLEIALCAAAGFYLAQAPTVLEVFAKSSR
jgi:hypothetical protein